MRRVFADTYYWIALLNDKDQGHPAAQAISQTLQKVTIVTTQEVLSELLTHFCEHGSYMRLSVVAFVQSILDDPSIEVRPQSESSFRAGFALYQARLDKKYSLTDCISMATMLQEGLSEVLSHDDHFTQDGFTCLL